MNCILTPGKEYRISSRTTGEVIKDHAKFITVIPRGHFLTEEECHKYFNAVPEVVRIRGSTNSRAVFDKVVVPMNPRFFIIEEEEDQED